MTPWSRPRADYAAVIRNILRVLPETTDIAVVLGNSPIEQYWVGQLRRAVQPFTDRVAFTWFNDLSLDEMLKRAATLPPKSAIFFFSVNCGRRRPLVRRGARHSPVFVPSPTHPSSPISIPFSATGSSVARSSSLHDTAQRTADVAIRILNGEAPGGIKTPPVGPEHRNSTGENYSAGTSARLACHPEAKFIFAS